MHTMDKRICMLQTYNTHTHNCYWTGRYKNWTKAHYFSRNPLTPYVILGWMCHIHEVRLINQRKQEFLCLAMLTSANFWQRGPTLFYLKQYSKLKSVSFQLTDFIPLHLQRHPGTLIQLASLSFTSSDKLGTFRTLDLSFLQETLAFISITQFIHFAY